MLTWETTVEVQALYARGWTKSAIARHLGINRRTVRDYLKGERVPGHRGAASYDITVDGVPFDPVITVDNGGRVHYHGLPSRDFPSTVEPV